MKNTYRFFVEPSVISGDLVEVTDSDLLHQWNAVLRLRPGQQIALLDGSGTQTLVELTTLTRRSAQGRVVSNSAITTEPRLQVTLFVALARGERFEWVLQKGTELGAAAFVPIHTAHAIADAVSGNKLERWRRIIREAAEQSGRSKLPTLAEPQSLDQTLQHEGGGIVLAEHSASVPFKQAAEAINGICGIWSGPEGGWSQAELESAHSAGLALAGLGPRILRAETAPIAALAALMYAHNEWSVIP